MDSWLQHQLLTQSCKVTSRNYEQILKVIIYTDNHLKKSISWLLNYKMKIIVDVPNNLYLWISLFKLTFVELSELALN